MINYIKFILNIIKNYKFSSIQIIFFEIIYIILYPKKYNKILLSNFEIATDPISSPFYYIKKIEKFIKKKKLNKICDFGLGLGKLIYYFGNVKRYKIDGVEIDKNLHLNAKKNFNDNNINLYNDNILTFNFINNNYDLIIINDPLKKSSDYEKLIFNIKKNNFNKYLIFINLNKNKLNLINKKIKILKFIKYSDTRNLVFSKIRY